MTAAMVIFVSVLLMQKRRGQQVRTLTPKQLLLGAAAMLVVLVILFNPEVAALGLLGDTAFVDLLVLLLGLQLRAAGTQLQHWIRRIGASFLNMMLSPRLSYLMVLATWISITDGIRRAIDKLSW